MGKDKTLINDSEYQNRKLKCPRCNIFMDKLNKKGIIIDFCSRCGGKWLDDEELNKLYIEIEVLKNKNSQLIEDKLRISRLMDDLNTALEKQKRLDKLKNNFLSITSHELKTPLTPIKAQLELVSSGMLCEVNKETKESLDLILKNVNVLNNLINDILDISKLESNNMKFIFEKIKFNDFIKERVNSLKINAENKNISVELNLDESVDTIEIDPKRIGQVINNLFFNALKFTNKGGKIKIETKKDNNFLVVKIIDTGIGIENKDLKRIFSAFEQVDSSRSRNFEGSGLGLAICKGIIIRHGGEIYVESEVGKGSVFVFKLPFDRSLVKNKENMELFFSEPNLIK